MTTQLDRMDPRPDWPPATMPPPEPLPDRATGIERTYQAHAGYTTTIGSVVRAVHVTEDNIRQGIAGSETDCPLALAMKDAGFIEPRVGPQGSVAGVDGVRYPFRANLIFDSVTSAMIRKVDNHEPVEPMDLVFNVPSADELAYIQA